MSWRAFLIFSLLLPGLAGCAGNRPLLATDGPLFGSNGAAARAGTMIASEAATTEADGYCCRDTAVGAGPYDSATYDEPSIVHTASGT